LKKGVGRIPNDFLGEVRGAVVFVIQGVSVVVVAVKARRSVAGGLGLEAE